MPIITSNISGYGSNSPIQISGSIVFANTQAPGSDTAFFVSGSNSARAVFGGALVVSGVLGVSGSTSLGDNVAEDTVTVRATSILQGTTAIGTTTTANAFFTVSGSSSPSVSTSVIREGVVSPTEGAAVLHVQNSTGTSLLFVSGSGNVGIGTTTFLTNNELAIFSSAPTSTFDGQILVSSNAASSVADNGGQLNFQMYDGSSYRGSGFIKSAKENGTASNYSSYMSFGTRNSGDIVITERMRIDSTGSVGIGATAAGRLYVTGSTSTSQPVFVVRAGTTEQTGGTKIVDVLNAAGTGLFHVSGSGDVTVGVGNLVIGTSGKGIDFGSTANAPSGSLGQEILDDYEEGSWTPGTTVGGGGTITSTRSGHYTKIGRVVHVKFFIEASAVSGTRTTLTITGLPFQVDVTYTNAWVECYQLNNTGGLTDDFSHGTVWTNATSNSLTFDIYETTSGAPVASPASFIVANTLISGHLTYFTNQ